MLSLNNLSYNNITISFSIFLSSLFIIKTLQNISGKNTFDILKIIAGLEMKQQNRIFWNNQKISDFYYHYSSDINLITSKNNLDGNLTIKQNLNFISSLSETKLLISSAIKYFEIDNILEKKIKNLTNEEIQRVKLSQLIFAPKTMWLLEQPDQFLTQKWQEKLFNLILTRIKEGGLVILTSDNKIFNKIGQIIDLNDFTNKNI
jgi:ABC-type transport system involved in cytochrome c biogenesis ATPase subunit